MGSRVGRQARKGYCWAGAVYICFYESLGFDSGVRWVHWGAAKRRREGGLGPWQPLGGSGGRGPGDGYCYVGALRLEGLE